MQYAFKMSFFPCRIDLGALKFSIVLVIHSYLMRQRLTTTPLAHSSPSVSTHGERNPASLMGNFESPRAGSSADFPQQNADSNSTDETELISVSWNQDYGCFSAGTSHGFRIYNCLPFKETFRRDLRGSFKIVEMLFQCNILALVGAVTNPYNSPNKVMIWDDYHGRSIGEFAFRSEVRAVKLRRDRIVVVLEHKIFVYNFKDLKLLQQIETSANPRGLCCLSYQPNTFVLACPGLCRGQVRVEHFGLNMKKLIHAHDSEIRCFTLTMDGLLLATASAKGTLIRIFNTMDGTVLQEVGYWIIYLNYFDFDNHSCLQLNSVSIHGGTSPIGFTHLQ